MIHGVLDTRNIRVERIMVPLSEIVAVERPIDVRRFIEVAAESGFSRIPVYENQIYDIIGIVHILDVIHSDVEGTIEPFIRRDIRFVPESKAINMLLRECGVVRTRWCSRSMNMVAPSGSSPPRPGRRDRGRDVGRAGGGGGPAHRFRHARVRRRHKEIDTLIEESGCASRWVTTIRSPATSWSGRARYRSPEAGWWRRRTS